ncbi:MAG: hypothetical protein AAFX06_02880 [Planctomycetota bacterium]
MSNDRSDDDAEQKLADRCLTYLLGEMPTAERAEFEQQLCDPDVASLFERESQLLLELADAKTHSPAPPSAAAPPSNAFSATRRVGWLMALGAAVLLLVGVAWQANQSGDDRGNGSMELRIAQAWADSPILSSDVLGDELGWTVEDDGQDETDELTDSIDWMVAAVEVDNVEDGRNDG